MKNLIIVSTLVQCALPVFGALPKISYEFINTYESGGLRGAVATPKVSGISIDGEIYEPEEVRCETGPICYYYHRILKQEKARKPLSEAAEAHLNKRLLKFPVVKRPSASDPLSADAYAFGCECLELVKVYRNEIGRLFMEYEDEGEEIAKLKALCDSYNKIVSSRAWKRLNSRGDQLNSAIAELASALRNGWICCSTTGMPDRRLFVEFRGSSGLMEAIEHAYSPLIDRVAKRPSLVTKEDEAIKKVQREARRARKLAKEAYESANAARIEAERAAMNASMNSGEGSTTFLVIPGGNGKVRVMGGGGTATIK